MHIMSEREPTYSRLQRILNQVVDNLQAVGDAVSDQYAFPTFGPPGAARLRPLPTYRLDTGDGTIAITRRLDTAFADYAYDMPYESVVKS